MDRSGRAQGALPEAATAPSAAPPDVVNLERRVKRHVHAPVHGWFAACAPGVEPVLVVEARALGLEDVAAIPGGVTFWGKLEAGYRANLHLRTANRVWLRVMDFSARAPEDVYREAHECPWEAFLPAGVPLLVQASTSRSRLFGGGFLGRPLRDAIARHLRALGLPDPTWVDSPAEEVVDESDPETSPVPLQRLLARLDGNRLTLSLDSSGELLHRRGFRLEHGGAPLRETLAATILLAAGYDGTRVLADPMCGSGTFGVEAAAIARHLPPGRSRDFLFRHWPSDRAATWEHLRRLAGVAALDAAPAPILCRDVDATVLDLARSHAMRAGVGPDIRFEAADFFTTPAPDLPPGLVVLNPPYGLRQDAGDDPVAFFRRVGRRLTSAWWGWSVAVVAPSPAAADALGLRAPRHLHLSHGGLRVTVVLAQA